MKCNYCYKRPTVVIKTLGDKFNKYFFLKEILEIEKDFVVKNFKEKSGL